MKNKTFLLFLLLVYATTVWADSNMDSASNYGSSWANGSNGGGGFNAWSISTNAGNGWAGGGIWDSGNADLNLGTAFGFAARGDNAVFTAQRDFSTALSDGDIFKLDLGLNYDSGTGGNKGFLLYAADNREIVLVNMADSETITVNGAAALTNYGTDTMHWTITQASPTQIMVYATGRTGSDTFITVLETTQASYLAGIKFYASSNVDDEYDEYRQVYFDNLILTQETAGTNDYVYTIENNAATIISANTTLSGAVTLPTQLGGYPVRTIGRAAFLNCTLITSITFPAGTAITNIGVNAFQGCTGLAYAILPDTLTELPSGLFYGCNNLLAVSIPATITHIGPAAFAQCRSLQEIELPTGLQSLDESALLNARSLGSITFPEGCTIAEEQVCYEGRSLVRIALPITLQEIQTRAFYNCLRLTRLDVDAANVALAAQAVAGCASLQKAVFHGGIAALGTGVFSGCTALEGIYTAANTPSTDAAAFDGLEDATLYYLPWTSGWNATLAGLPTATWLPLLQNMRMEDDALTFDVEWANGYPLTTRVCDNLETATWQDISTSTPLGGAFTVQDPAWTTRSTAFYQARYTE